MKRKKQRPLRRAYDRVIDWSLTAGRLGNDFVYGENFEFLLDFLIHYKTARRSSRRRSGASRSVRRRNQSRIHNKIKRVLFLYRREFLSGATFLLRPRFRYYLSIVLFAGDYLGFWEEARFA